MADDDKKEMVSDKAKKDAEEMAKMDAAKADAEAGEKLDKVLACLDTLGKRMDAYDDAAKADAAKKDEFPEDLKEKKEEKKDSEEEDKKEEKKDAAKADGDDKEDPEKLAADKAKKDAEEEEEKKMDKARKDAATADAATNKRIDDMREEFAKKFANRTHEDSANIGQTQSQMFKAYKAIGDSALEILPITGETPAAYRRRCASALQKFSPKWEKADLKAQHDYATFKVMSDEIFADAVAFGSQPASVPDGILREIVNEDHETGRRTKTFAGRPSTWMQQFSSGRRLAKLNLSHKD